MLKIIVEFSIIVINLKGLKIMKSITINILLLILIFFSAFFVSNAQNYLPVDWLNKYKNDVLAGSYTYTYDFKYFNKENCGIRVVTIKKNKKGDENENYTDFYLSDIDENTISFKVSGKYITVNMLTKGAQKFVREYEDNVLKSYGPKIEIYTDEVEKARSMVDAFKSHLNECKGHTKSWNSLKESMEWLSATISKTTHKNIEYEQVVRFDGLKNYLVTFERNFSDTKGYFVSDLYKANLADIDPNKIELYTSGADLSIKLSTKENKKYIENVKNGKKQNYNNDFEIYVPDLETARDIHQALKYAVSSSKPEYTSWTDVIEALTYLKNNITEIFLGNYQYEQVFEFEDKPDGMVYFTSKRTDSRGNMTLNKYSFYVNELNPTVSFNILGDDVKLELVVKDKNKFIKTFQDGELKNYSYEIDILVDNIESARELSNAFTYVITNKAAGLIEWNDVNKATDWITSNVGDISESSNTYKQKFTVDIKNNYKSEFNLTTTDSKGDTEEKFEFYLSDINADKLLLDVSGEKLYVDISTGDEKLVKSSKFNELQSFTSSVEVVFGDTKMARNFINALKYAAQNIKVNEPGFDDKKNAVAYIKSTLQTVSTGSDVYDQTLEIVEDNPCKMKLTQTKTDSKGIATEYIFEFLLGDINPNAIGLEISGKELTVKLETKNKEKLIKPYKNNEPQNFDYGIEIFSDDVMTARNISKALKFAANACKK